MHTNNLIIKQNIVIIFTKQYGKNKKQFIEILKNQNTNDLDLLRKQIGLNTFLGLSLEKIIEEKQNKEKKIPFGRQYGKGTEPKSTIVKTKEQYLIYKKLLEKAFDLGNAKTDIALMIYFLAKYNDLNKKWNLIAKAKTSREIKGLWSGKEYLYLQRALLTTAYDQYHHNAEKQRLYFTHDFIRATYYPLHLSENGHSFLFLLKNIPIKFDWTERWGIDIVVNENIGFNHIEKIYIHDFSEKEKKELLDSHQKYPHILFVFYSKTFLETLTEHISYYSNKQDEIG